jgi:hypothetical protein
MANDIIFNKTINDLIVKNVEIFTFEFPSIPENDWKDFAKKPNCKCRNKIFEELKKEKTKFDSVMSRLMGEEVEIHFPAPLDEPIVKEFENLKKMEEYLKELKRKGTVIRNANPSPDGKGGFILIVM